MQKIKIEKISSKIALKKYKEWSIISLSTKESVFPGMYDTPISLNLHLRFGTPILPVGCQASDYAVEGRKLCCGNPPSLARRQIIGNGILGIHNS